jgi:hypothetical protein
MSIVAEVKIPIDAKTRAEMKQWLDTWKRVGPILDAGRWARVRALTDEEAWRESEGLFQLWEPRMTGDAGEGLLCQQAVFARARRREVR